MFLPNVAEDTFIQGDTFIPESRVAIVRDLEQRIENLTAKKKCLIGKKNRQIRDGGIHAQELC